MVFGAAVGSAPLRDWAPIGVPVAGDVLTALTGVAVTSVLLLGVLRIVTAPAVATVRLVPAALLSGLLWELLQRLGAPIVADRLARADDLYGALGVVVVTLFWINLLARAIIVANEWAVVGWRELWPRRIAQPPLTDADRRVLVFLARNERRRPEQHVEITFGRDDVVTEA